jgi:tRNA/rRNA methyltransferase
MEFIFILVEPAVPANVGASARAMKTMGFSKLRLVNPCHFRNTKAKQLAHGSHEILENAMVFDSLAKATEDCHFVVGTSAKHRRVKHDHYRIAEMADLIMAKKNIIDKVGIVFGREDHGLENDELNSCDIISYIPMKTEYPSLNLAQAVMIYAWELSGFNVPARVESKIRKEDEFRNLKKKVGEFLHKNQISRNQVLHNRILERLGLLNEVDIHLLLSIYKHLNMRP